MQTVALDVCAMPDSGTLSRIVGVFAQLGLPPPELQVIVEASEMRIQIKGGSDVQTTGLVERKIWSVLGVESVSRTKTV